MSATKFRLGAKVTYRTHRPPRNEGSGKIAAIHEGLRGAWYEVQPTDKSLPSVRVRVSGLALRA